MISLEARFFPKDGVHARRFGDEVVLLDLQGGLYYGLNVVGAHIWEGLAAGQSLEEVAREVVERFDTDLATVRADVERVAADLIDRGLLAARKGQ